MTRNNTDSANINKIKTGRKTTVWRFQATNKILQEKTWTWLRKGNLKRENSLQIAAKNNAIRTKYIKVRIDKTQKIADLGYVVIETK